MIRRFVFTTLSALALAGVMLLVPSPAVANDAGRPSSLLCQVEDGVIKIPIDFKTGLAPAVQQCLSLKGHPVGVV